MPWVTGSTVAVDRLFRLVRRGNEYEFDDPTSWPVCQGECREDRSSLMSNSREHTPTTLRIATRGSQLARLQTDRVASILEAAHPGLRCEIVVVSTQGDRDKQTPLAILGGQGVFAKELQQAVLRGEADCAVHSVKDLTSEMPAGLTLAAILDRADPRDVLISRHPGGLAGLPTGARVGTSSRRRVAELRLARPDLVAVELRGNVDSRIRKVLDDPEAGYDAAILAAAGVERMERGDTISEYLDVDRFIPAPGQGALGVDCRSDDRATRALLETIADSTTTIEVEAERTFLRVCGGGCRSPLAAYAQADAGIVRMWAMYADESLDRIATTEDEDDMEDANSLATRLATTLRERVEA